MNEERDCESGLAHKAHLWSQGHKQYQCYGRTETQGLSKEPVEVIDTVIGDIETSMNVMTALDRAGLHITPKWRQ